MGVYFLISHLLLTGPSIMRHMTLVEIGHSTFISLIGLVLCSEIISECAENIRLTADLRLIR